MSWSAAIKPDWMSRAVTKEVIRAAEEPRPVFATSVIAMPIGLNGGNLASEASKTGNWWLLSCSVKVVRKACSIGEELRPVGDTYLVLLRVKVIICDDGDVKASTKGPFNLCGASRL
jgi:hypothetical protein